MCFPLVTGASSIPDVKTWEETGKGIDAIESCLISSPLSAFLKLNLLCGTNLPFVAGFAIVS